MEIQDDKIDLIIPASEPEISFFQSHRYYFKYADKKIKRYFYPHPFEINLRLSSTVYMRHHLGFCDAVWWVNDVLSGIARDKRGYKSSGTAYRVYDYVFLDGA